MSNPLTVRVNTTLKRTSVEQIKKLADLEKRSVSSMVDILLVEALKNRKQKPK